MKSLLSKPHRSHETASTDSNLTGAAERSLRVLSLLAEEGRPMRLEELGERMSLSRTSMLRLCQSLLAANFVIRDIEEHSYTLGAASRELASSALHHGHLRVERHSILKALSLSLGETCNFTTLDGVEVLYVDRVEFKRPLRLATDVGSRLPIHSTSSGKLLLANLPKALRDDLIARLPLPQSTVNTITSREALLAECTEILKQGYAQEVEEFVAGLASIAVPVRDAEGIVRATISVHALKERFHLANAKSRLSSMKAAADAMGYLL
ncbi:IclR family transcriptional regulator [Comamonas testosteroni]|uniref:IclR family transcriptional regulator n=1 Tax=Comamonas testosteroni TaxID=285 RepID=UPI0026F1ADD3|nr:IclR family transcriptional regulator [Comamonas testosteroni]